MVMKNIKAPVFFLVCFLLLLTIIQSQPFFLIDTSVMIFLYCYLALLLVVLFVSDDSMTLSNFSKTAIGSIVFTILFVLIFPDSIQSKPLQFLTQLILALVGTFLIVTLRNAIARVETAANRLIYSVAPSNCCSYEEAEPYITYEINRSRRYGNPLTFLSVKLAKPEEKQTDPTINEPVVRKLFKEQFNTEALRIFYSTIRATDVLIDASDHYVIMMVDTPRKNAQVLIDRLVRNFQNELGYTVYAGIAEFPDDGIIYMTLVETANKKMANYTQKMFGNSENE